MVKPFNTGYTQDKKPVVYSSLFQFKDQEGLPVEISAAKLIKESFIPNWLYEVEGALWLGYSEEKILTELSEVFRFLYPKSHVKQLKKVRKYLQIRTKPNPFTAKAMKETKP